MAIILREFSLSQLTRTLEDILSKSYLKWTDSQQGQVYVVLGYIGHEAEAGRQSEAAQNTVNMCVMLYCSGGSVSLSIERFCI